MESSSTNRLSLSDEDVSRIADAVCLKLTQSSGMNGHLTDGDLLRLSARVMALIEERTAISTLADMVMQKTSARLEEIKQTLTDNPFHNPAQESPVSPVKLTEKEAKLLADARESQKQSRQLSQVPKAPSKGKTAVRSPGSRRKSTGATKRAKLDDITSPRRKRR